MAQQNVSVTSTGMQRACGIFQDATATATSQMEAVNGCERALMASWTGEASMGFSRAMNDWEQAFNVIITQLAHMIDVMGGAANTYVQNEQNAAEIAPKWSADVLGLANF